MSSRSFSVSLFPSCISRLLTVPHAVVADKAPLAMSIITLVTFLIILLTDFASSNAFVARAPFQLSWTFVLSVFWLAANAFSTSRWRHVPLQCAAIPAGFESEQAWCRDLQALKSFVWVEWLCRQSFFSLAMVVGWC